MRTRKGLSVEVDNTDAEGRLILCDAFAEAETEGPDLLVDFATLTGHCRITLRADRGIFTNWPSLGHELFDIGSQLDDPLWQMPLHRPYRELMKSSVADLSSRRVENYAGAITAALYLEYFVDDQTPWVHIDFMA